MLALIAHDRAKEELLEFVDQHIAFFRSRSLIATGHTGNLLRDELALAVTCVEHGPQGGDIIIGGMIAQGEIDAVIFFRDPLTAQPHEPDVLALLRVCDVHKVPLATNRSTAEAVVRWMLDG